MGWGDIMAMLIPKNTRKQKSYVKQCAYEGCNTQFIGITIAKYCKKHRQEEYRMRKRNNTDPADTNRIIQYSKTIAERTMLICECCGKEFEAVLYPRQTVYPKYCNEHTNAHRRKMYKAVV